MTGTGNLLAALAVAVTGAWTHPLGVAPPVLTPLPPPAPVTTPLPERGDVAAWVTATVPALDAPGGTAVGRLRPQTEFGSPHVVPIVRRRGDWLGVIASTQPNGRVVWVDAERVQLIREPVRVEVSLS